MRRLLSLAVSRFAVVLLAFLISSVGIIETLGDCAFEGVLDASATAMCLHGDSGRHEQEPEPCTTEHHGAAHCVCSCHTAGIVPSATSAATAQLVQQLPPLPIASVFDRREPPVLRPPIRG